MIPDARAAKLRHPMSGTIELDRDGHHLVIRFPYDPYLVDEVKALPSRRWDKRDKCWRVPATHAEAVIDAFMKHGFEIASEVMGILAGTVEVADKPKKAAKPTESTPQATATAGPSEDGGPWTVLQLNERVREALRVAFPGRVQVVGEVLEFDKNRERKHIFFQLVEKAAVGDRPAATVDVALFERTAQRVLPLLESKGMTLRDGIEILIEARIDLYPASGRYQLLVDDIRPEFTLGKLALTKEQILATLREAGLHERNLALGLPTPTLRIGVLSSPDSDGWNDFLRELEGSGIGFEIGLYPVRVQGEELQRTVLGGLDYFRDHQDDFDVVCIVRGGGSRTDLAWWDDEKVARAVAEHPLKVLVGIGHERDRSVLDEIATSLKTPTATAAFLVDLWHEQAAALQDTAERLRRAATGVCDRARERLADRAHLVVRAVSARLAAERQALVAAGPRLTRGTRHFLHERNRDLLDAALRIRSVTAARLRDEHHSLDRAAERIAERSQRRLERAGSRLHEAETRLRLLDPQRVLERGYALVRNPADGKVVTDAAALQSNALADITFRDGSARVRVESIQPRPG